MQWPSAKSKKFVSASLLGCVLSAPVFAEVDDKRLWLPGGKYATLFFELRKAAEAAEGLERCVTVLRGTVDLDRSSVQHPIYRILCRQENGRSYNEMVDGKTFETLTTKALVSQEPNEVDHEAARLAEEQRIENARLERIAALWAECETELKDKTRLMHDVVWLAEFPLEPDEYSESSAHFSVAFDAKSVEGALLQYQAQCVFDEEAVLNVNISGRK